MIKKLLGSWLLCRVAMLLTLCSVSLGLSAEDKFYMPDFVITAGETKQVAICFDSDNISDYCAFQFDIYMPEGLTVTKSDGKYDIAFNPLRHNNHILTSNDRADGAIRVISYAMPTASFKEPSGNFIYLTVTAASDYSDTQTIELKNIDFAVLSNLNELVRFPDSQTNVTAVVKVPGADFYMPDFEIVAGETKQVAICFDSDNISDYCAFLFDIYMPDGLTVTKSNGKYDIAFNPLRHNNHILTSNDRADGAIRVISYAMPTASFKESSGNFIYLTVTAASDYSGTQTIELRNIDFTVLSNLNELVRFPESRTNVTAVTKIPVESVSLNQTSVTLTVGGFVTLQATVTPNNATDKTVTWTSSDATKAIVTDAGMVVALKPGTVIITATADGKSAACVVTIKDEYIPVESVSLNKSSVILAIGEYVTLTATVTPNDATDKTVTWSSTDMSVAEVINGIVIARKSGTAVVIAKAGDKVATCVVTVKEKDIAVTGISLDKTSATLTVGETLTLIATVTPDDATDKNVTWISLNETVAKVSNGVVIANGVGETTIIAMAGQKTANCLITVKEACSHSFDDNGFCINSGCSAYQPAVYNNNGTEDNASDDYYEVNNAGQVYWLSDMAENSAVDYGVSYRREFPDTYKYSTIVLPFMPDAESISNYTFYGLAAVDEAAGYMRFTEITNPQAGVPYLYCKAAGVMGSPSFRGKATDINTEPVSTIVSGWEMTGSYLKHSIDCEADAGSSYYAYNAPNNQFNRITKKLNVTAFRAYIYSTGTTSAKQLRVEIGGVTGIVEINTDQIEGFKSVFDLSGRYVSQPQKGIYIINGKKILVK